MLFDFEAEQYEFRDVVRSMLSQHVPAAAVRAVWDNPTDRPAPVWARLVELGLLGLLVPEQHGGLGGLPIDLALPLEELGYHAVTEPVVETAAVTAPVLSQFASDDVKAQWLPRIATGEAAIALSLNGTGLVSHATRADAVLARAGDALYLAPAKAIESEPLESMDPTLRLARCTFDLDQSILVSDVPAAAEYAGQLGTVATASLLVGLSQRMIDMTRAHLLERQQFGEIIGSFQSLKHRLADVAVATEAARGLAWYGAYANSSLPEKRAEAANLAKGSASRAAYLAGSAALQLHGGIGFTWEHDLHLWLQRAKSLETLFGSVHEHREDIADRVFAH